MNKLIFEELNKLLSAADKLWIIRKRKINTKLLFELMSKVLSRNNGIKHVLAYEGHFNEHPNISDVALCKSRKRCGYTIFQQIKTNLLLKFNKSQNIYAVDGSKFRLPDVFSKEGFITRSSNSNHILGMLSTVFDVHTKIPVNTLICKHHNERTAICQQLNTIPNGSTLIFDRGYYSQKMVNELEKNNIKYLFRLKKDANRYVNKFHKCIKNVNKQIKVGDHKMRIFKYTIDGKTYLCGTNKQSSINNLKKLYKKRWTVEEGFKTMKSPLHLKTIHSKTLNLLKQEILIREILFIVTRMALNSVTKQKKNYKLSFKLALDLIINSTCIMHAIPLIDNVLIHNQFKIIPNRRRKNILTIINL
jgi:predicted transposase YbfD/YdcC